MAVLILNSANLNVFVARIEAIRSDSKRLFGMMEPAAMFSHLSAATELSLGEIESVDISNFFSRHVVKRLVFQTPMPWPKGKIKAPDYFTPPPKGDADAERARLIALIKRFIETAEREPNRKTQHPIFGQLTLKYWQRAHGKHFDHHFAQFGA